MSHDTIIAVGRAVRRFLHRLRKNPRRGHRSFGNDLTGACAVGSVVLVEILRRLGMSAELVLGTIGRTSHAWVELTGEPNGIVIDVTATQFGKYPAVYLTDQRDPRYARVDARGEGALASVNSWGTRLGEKWARGQAPVVHAEEIRAFVETIAA